MKHLIQLFGLMLVIVMPLVGCESASESIKAPTVEVKALQVADTSVTLAVMAVGAEECAYMLFDGDVITAEQVLTNGVVVEGDGVPFNVSNLKTNTTYYIVAAARNAAGAVLSEVLSVKTSKGVNGGGNDDDNGGNEDIPEGALKIAKTKDGRWYKEYNYYVTLVAETGERIILDFYTIDETMSNYLPYGSYELDTNNTLQPYTIGSEYSGIILEPEQEAEEGYLFTSGYCNVDVVNGMYALYFDLNYDVDGVSHNVTGYYNGALSGASVPKGDDDGSEELIEVLEVGSTSFRFRINAEDGQYWRCSVVDKRIYDQTQSNPGAWVVTYGFMLSGTLKFNWENGKECEYIPGYMMNVSSSTDYLILAALMDYSEGDENSLLGGVEIVQLRTNAEGEGTATADVTIKDIGVNDVTFDCVFGDDVWCCYVAMMETANLQEIKDGKYALAGYESYEECMLSLIPSLSHDNMRQFLEPQYDYKWDYLNYGTSYTMCIKVVDMNNGAKYIELDPFTTK